MPAYDYRCIDCQHEYEKREGFDAPALQRCPTCGGTARRVIHAPPVLFKGSGFYVTDSRKSTPESEAEAKSEAAASKSEGSATADKPSKDDKPSTKKDEKPAKDAEPAADKTSAAAS